MTLVLSSAELHQGENQNKHNPNQCHHPLITQLSINETCFGQNVTPCTYFGFCMKRHYLLLDTTNFVSLALSSSPQSTTTNVTPGSKLLKSALPSPSASYKQAIMQKTTHSKPSNSMLPLPNALNQNQNNSSNSTSTSNAPSSSVVASSKIYQQHQRENQTHTGPSNPR